MKIKTTFESETPIPDVAEQKALNAQEVEALKGQFAGEEKAVGRREKNLKPLIQAAGWSDRELKGQLKAAATNSRGAIREAKAAVAKPSLDVDAMHKRDLYLAKQTAEKLESPGNPHWQGYVWSASGCGAWWNWNGESEETPQYSCNLGAERVDIRTQAFGEGWFDSDFSQLHGFLQFHLTPPSWGHLHVYTYPWLHGWYSLYSNDEWWNSEYAEVELDTWVDIHQNFWRPRTYRRRLTIRGDELHPTRFGRVDSSFGHAYFTNVGARDRVTIRVGARLYSRAKASGTHAILDFRGGAGNYVYVPYVYWYLHN